MGIRFDRRIRLGGKAARLNLGKRGPTLVSPFTSEIPIVPLDIRGVTQRRKFAMSTQTELELQLGLPPLEGDTMKAQPRSATAAHLGSVKKALSVEIQQLRREDRQLLVALYAEIVALRREVQELKTHHSNP